ncbi:MAG: cold-shock protein [bacterium]
MYQGTVKWFSETKGYGFISPGKGEDDIFVHYSDIRSSNKLRSLGEGDIVQYDVIQEEKGKKAQNVSVIYDGNK